MNLRRWILVYLATGPSFTRWAVLAFYGGGLLVVGLVALAALVLIGGRVLEDAVECVAADIRKATREYEEAANRVQGRLGVSAGIKERRFRRF